MTEEARGELRKTIEDLAEWRRRLTDRRSIITNVENAIAKSELGQLLAHEIQSRDECQERIVYFETQLRAAASLEYQQTGIKHALCEGACDVRDERMIHYVADNAWLWARDNQPRLLVLDAKRFEAQLRHDMDRGDGIPEFVTVERKPTMTIKTDLQKVVKGWIGLD